MVKKIIIGLVAGVVSGLFGAGGGLILVPALIYIFKFDEKIARATSIACILPMVLTTGFFYLEKDFINWEIGVKCAIGGIIGSYIGSKLLYKLSDKFLQISYIVFLSYVSIRFIKG